MNYDQYKIEDFLLDEQFKKWILNPEKEDNVYWENFLAKNPRKSQELLEAREILLNLSMNEYKLSSEEASELWDRIEKKTETIEGDPAESKVIPINSYSILKKQEKNRHNYSWLRVAVISAILIISAVGLLMIKEHPLKESAKVVQQMTENKTDLGVKAQVALSDGTQVILNSGSKLRYFRNFSATSRDVYLEGEAYFNVAKDSERPFNVYTGDVVTTAIGTAFNINNYSDNDNSISISLVEGKVMVKLLDSLKKASGESYFLTPGESVNYNPGERNMFISKFDLKEKTSWKDGVLYFSNASEEEVYKRIERWYGVKIEKQNATPKAWSYSAEFKDQGLHQVLTSLSFTMNFDYKVNNSTIVITYNNK